MRLVTFNLAEVDTEDELDIEKAWNAFVEDLRILGLRPAEEPTRWTETSATYRVFHIEHDEMEFHLDFDISKLGKIATAVALAGILLSTTVDKIDWFVNGVGAVVA